MQMKTPKGFSVIHGDHGLTEAHLALIDHAIEEGKATGWTPSQGALVVLVPLPDDVPALPSALYGPQAGDPPIPDNAVYYARRGGRPRLSRLIEAPLRPCHAMQVAAGRGRREALVVYTAFGTQAIAPREVGDPTLTADPEAAKDSAKFWALHALADGSRE